MLRLKCLKNSNIFNNLAKTIIINTIKDASEGSNRWIKVEDMHPENILSMLYTENIQSILIEGGAQVLKSFIESDCWDEARVFSSSKKIGNGKKAPILKSVLDSQNKVQDGHINFL